MPHQVTDQRPVVGNFPSPFAITHPSCLRHRRVVAHDVDQADKTVVQHMEFLPAKLVHKSQPLLRSLLIN